jgi:hypothetical protein
VQPELVTDVRQLDLTAGFPKPPSWQDVSLVYLDPPYWKQAEGKYSKDPTDLANMSLEDFTATIAKIIRDFAKRMTQGHIALILQPTQWNAPGHEYTDHVADLLTLIKLKVAMRIQCPYESQQANAQMVTWAKDNRQLLGLNREIVIWAVGL